MGTVDRFMPKDSFLSFAAGQEPWAEYKLENGIFVRFRLMLVKAVDHGLFVDGEMKGYPNIQFKMQQITDVTWPDDIKAAAVAAGGNPNV